MASTVKPKKYVGNITASTKRLARWICCRKLRFSIVNRSRSHNFVVVLCGSVISGALLFVVSATTSAYNVDVSLKRAHFVATSWWAVNYTKQLNFSEGHILLSKISQYSSATEKVTGVIPIAVTAQTNNLLYTVHRPVCTAVSSMSELYIKRTVSMEKTVMNA